MILPEEAPAPCAAELAPWGLIAPGKRKRKKPPEPPVREKREAVPPERVLPEGGKLEAEPVMPLGRMPLLRYPPGEGPLYQGSGRWR
jgi:hypothetical protein